ncbi:MAG TPA: helix-turn-helix domain-containing protein [Tepidiformaceae bacterium]|nr:helix-turn-helix domain-containing protein [Tepidiformaceae bacterium]
MGELGSLLIRAREARGLTIEDAERDTRISRRYLQALEAEQFEVIPAPVYARGFLRSYSQYLGLDPQETLALFPRNDEPSPYYATPGQGPARPAPQQQQQQQRAATAAPPQPPPTVGGQGPTWRRQPRQAAPAAPPRPARPGDPGWEPTIGVDVGVPAPARRIKTDPAAQARSMTVLVVAVAAIVAVVLMALAISRLGGGTQGAATNETPTTDTGAGATETTTVVVGGATVTPGVMPNVEGLTEGAAKELIISAGAQQNAISVTTQRNAASQGTVYDQFPKAGAPIEEGQQVIIAVSQGP